MTATIRSWRSTTARHESQGVYDLLTTLAIKAEKKLETKLQMLDKEETAQNRKGDKEIAEVGPSMDVDSEGQ